MMWMQDCKTKQALNLFFAVNISIEHLIIITSSIFINDTFITKWLHTLLSWIRIVADVFIDTLLEPSNIDGVESLNF